MTIQDEHAQEVAKLHGLLSQEEPGDPSGDADIMESIDRLQALWEQDHSLTTPPEMTDFIVWFIGG